MKEHELESYLMEVFEWAGSEDGMITDFESFESKGLLTNKSGIVLKLKNGSEFQLSITKTK